MMRIWLGRVLAVGVVVAGLAILHPWHVLPIGTVPEAAPDASAPVHDLAALWQANLAKAAKPVSAASAQSQLLVGTGRVVSIDRTSQVGQAIIQTDGGIKVSMQIGPILRGTDLRDAFGLKFGDFDTQVQYAVAAESLNNKALAVLKRAQGLLVPGQKLHFTGAGTALQPGAVALVPMALEAAP